MTSLRKRLGSIADTFEILPLALEAVFLDSGPIEEGATSKPYLPSVILKDDLGERLKHVCENSYKSFFKASPLPYLISSKLMRNSIIETGQIFSFSFVLMGEACRIMETAIKAFDRLGVQGLGRGASFRRRFRLLSAQVKFKNEDFIVWDSAKPAQFITPPRMTLSAFEPSDDLAVDENTDLKLRVDYVSPTCFAFDGLGKKVSPSRVTAYRLAQKASRRLQQIYAVWCNREWDNEKERIKFDYEAADQPCIYSRQTTLQYQSYRKSGTQGNIQPLRGRVCNVTYQGKVLPLYHLLSLCQPIGIGENTAWGFGQFKVSLST
ncbi:MAG: CRISPR system precrRNA processing endoribonuclease RAMP protein Cas6 [Deltaproteobacteria bacterium]|nr:CRISPR system precrRNA processing endoribonuclease RAMP protein Cas6 [Deltaproteobacteria bacterium]